MAEFRSSAAASGVVQAERVDWRRSVLLRRAASIISSEAEAPCELVLELGLEGEERRWGDVFEYIFLDKREV